MPRHSFVRSALVAPTIALGLIACSRGVTVSTSAPSPSAPSASVDLTKPPVLSAPKSLTLPAIVTRELPNGLRIMVVEQHELPLADFVTGVKRNALAGDELITAVRLTPSGAPQTFMKVGPRNAMVIAVVSLAVSAGDELRAAIGSASPRPVVVTAPRDEVASFPERVAAAASPIDDVRGTAAYRRHALEVLTRRALERTLAA